MLPVVIIACRVLESLVEELLNDTRPRTIYMDYGLHRVPQRMSTTLQAELDALSEPSLVLLGYGLCGNGLVGLQAGSHTLVVPRADDCIALLLGSYETYIEEFTAVPGTYYLTKGWLESGSHPLKEYREYQEKYGQATAEWLVDQQYHNYRRLVLVAHNQAELEAYRPQALEVARFCEARWGMRYEERLGSSSFVRRLLAASEVLGHLGGEFLVIPPGGEVRQGQFIR
ncbi:MAG: DUF1638 domain-containing protein [Anaerolineales bacterium]|nr:DUF1638 domain-containing protein [Anaerolineales bacterium]